MGLLDDLLPTDYFGGSGREQKRAERIHGAGTASPGTLVGMKFRHPAESATRWFFAVDVQPEASARFRGHCRESIVGVGEQLRLGMPIEVRHDEERVLISWDGTCPGGWHHAKSVADGIDDERTDAGNGEPSEATVLGFRAMDLLGLQRRERDVRLALGGGEERRITVAPPEWACHLLAPGTTWPVRREGDRIRVDWLAALERHGTGIGVVTPEPTEGPADVPAVEERLADAITSSAARLVAKGDAGEVDAETWIAVSTGFARDRIRRKDRDAYAAARGVPPGTWSAADAAWQRRLIGDADLQQRYAAALRDR